MERTKVVSVKPRWRKEGGGSLRLLLNGLPRIIKPGEVFSADLEEIPAPFRSSCVALDGSRTAVAAAEEQAKTKKPPVAPAYQIVPRGKSNSWFDVVNSLGKKMNEKALSKTTADELVRDLAK